MRITIDARMMGAENTRGIGRYIEELVRALLAEAPEHHYTLIVRDESVSPFQGHSSVTHVRADISWYGFEEQRRMPGVLASTKPDIVHIPHWNVPIWSRLPRVVTIHDLILLEEPASAKVSTRDPLTKLVKWIGFRRSLHSALYGSRAILTPTQWVRSRIQHFFPSLKTSITVTGEGMPEGGGTRSETAEDYLLYVGSAYPHKNLALLLEAWQRLASRHPNLSLRIVGERDVFMKRLETQAAFEGLQRIQFLGSVSDEALSSMYQNALAFVFPSRNEGFGLPPLEALAHGCPAIVARSSCLPEVLGEEGAIFFEPGSADGIIEAVETVLQDPVGARTQAREATELLRKRHSWQRTARHTLEAYQKAVSSKGR